MRSLAHAPDPDRWPAFVLPQPDELLSSWLLRTAHAHQMKAHTFCRLVWPGQSIWNRDADRMASPAVWQMMAHKTGVSPERSYQATLASLEGRLFERHQSNGHNRWLMPLGIYHREHTRHGMQCCPGCLKADGDQPYYRRWWRLSLAVACPHCGTELIDACPRCERPIVFHRSEIGKKNELATYPLSYCAYCQANLASADVPLVSPLLFRYQQHWYDRVNFANFVQGGHDYFDVLRHILLLLTSRRPRLIRFQQVVCEEIGITYQVPGGGYSESIDRLRLSARLSYMLQAGWLSEDWPKRFVAVAKKSKCWSSFIIQDGLHLPGWFIETVRSNLTNTLY